MTSSRQFPIKPFRFGVQASSQPDRKSWIDLAKRTEAAGFDVLTMPDHFTDQLAPLPALTAAAMATSTLRVGALVWDNDYKHPVVFAKEMATLDVLSDGRLDLGIGAGWMITDYEQSGIPYESAGTRIDKMIEGIDIMKGCFAQGPFSYAGKHYTITNYNGMPKPVQGSCPPILIGGGGKRVLTYAAKVADIVGINATMSAGAVGPEAISTMTAEAVDAKVDIVREASGDRIKDIEMNIRTFFVKVTNDRAKTVDSISSMFGVAADMINNSPFALIGSVEECIEQLLERRERWGFSYTIVGAENIDECAPIVAALRGK